MENNFIAYACASAEDALFFSLGKSLFREHYRALCVDYYKFWYMRIFVFARSLHPDTRTKSFFTGGI